MTTESHESKSKKEQSIEVKPTFKEPSSPLADYSEKLKLNPPKTPDEFQQTLQDLIEIKSRFGFNDPKSLHEDVKKINFAIDLLLQDARQKFGEPEAIILAAASYQALEQQKSEALHAAHRFGFRDKPSEIKKRNGELRELKQKYELMVKLSAEFPDANATAIENIKKSVQHLDHAIETTSRAFQHAENMQTYQALEQKGRMLIRENELPHPPEYLGRMKPESVAPLTPEYLAFIQWDPNILRKLMIFRESKTSAMALGGMYDYQGVHTLAKELQYDQPSIPFPINELYAEGYRTRSV